MKARGDCFEVSGKVILNFHPEYPFKKGMKLVHGIVSGQGPLTGIRFGHAWIEHEGVVLDISCGKERRMPQELYYALGKISHEGSFYYSREQAREHVLKTEHWGPWELEAEY